MSAELVVDKEFEELIPPLTDEEREQLETNCIADGIRDAIIVWKGENIIVDGMNRYAIAQKNGLKYKTKELDFGSREDVMRWMVGNQLGRRNLSGYARTHLALKLKDSIKENHEGDEPQDTREEIAKLADVSSNTVSRVAMIDEYADEETKDKLARGEMSINKAYNEIKEQQEPKESPKVNPLNVTALTVDLGAVSNEEAQEKIDTLLDRLNHLDVSTRDFPVTKQRALVDGIEAIGSGMDVATLNAAINLLDVGVETTPIMVGIAKALLQAAIVTRG